MGCNPGIRSVRAAAPSKPPLGDQTPGALYPEV